VFFPHACLSFILKFSGWNGFSSNLSAHHSTLLACNTVEAKAKPAQPGLSTQLLVNIVIVMLFIVETITSLQTTKSVLEIQQQVSVGTQFCAQVPIFCTSGCALWKQSTKRQLNTWLRVIYKTTDILGCS
jgi:hypothetical protein